MKELMDQLEMLGFYRLLPPAAVQIAKDVALQTAYLFSGETHRDYPADSEELAEGGVLDMLGAMDGFLRREGVTIGEKTQDFNVGGSYTVTADGEEYEMYSEEELETEDIWVLTTVRALSMVNALLARADSLERLYYLYGGNDTVAVFLTPAMYETIAASSALAAREKPNAVS